MQREGGAKASKRASKIKKWTRSVTMGLFLGAVGAGGYLFLNRSLSSEEETVPVNTAHIVEEVWEEEGTLLPQKKPVLVIEETPLEEARVPDLSFEEPVPFPMPVEVTLEKIPEKTAEEKHLLSVDQHYYTLQLVGARKESGVKAFIQRHSIEDKAYYFKTKLGGKEWYVVVYGEYPSVMEAKQAMAEMPSSMKQEKLAPWIRKMEAIHQDIKQIS